MRRRPRPEARRYEPEHYGTREIRPHYSVLPDDDLYGSPRSWAGATLEEQSTEGSGETRATAAAPTKHYATSAREWATVDDTRRASDSRLRRFPSSPSSEESRTSVWAVQWITALFLTGAAFLFAHSSQPVATFVTERIHNAFSTDLTRIDVPPAIARSLGSLPTSSAAQFTIAPADLQIVPPVHGAVVQSYSSVSPDVVFESRPGAAVVAAAEGLINSVGESQANGFYVTIDHGALGQTIYSHLARLLVHAQEYVTAGQVLGYLPSTSGKLTFGYIRNGSYQNPSILLKAAKS